MRRTLRSWLLLAIAPTLLVLGGCGKSMTPEKDLQDTLNLFVESLRWGDAHSAAQFFVEPLDRDYLDRYARREGLNVTDVQLMDVRFKPEGLEAEVSLRMEYFILPNASLRRMDVTQLWRQALGGPPGRTIWRLHSPFPELE